MWQLHQVSCNKLLQQALATNKKMVTMPDNFDRRRGNKPNTQSRPNQDQNKPRESPKRGDRGPYFLPKLLGQEVTVHLTTGQEVIGTLRGFNSYELLIEPTSSDELSLVFRSAIVKVNFKAELIEASKNKRAES
jgi:sRNA-binding regulator protein Hfq